MNLTKKDLARNTKSKYYGPVVFLESVFCFHFLRIPERECVRKTYQNYSLSSKPRRILHSGVYNLCHTDSSLCPNVPVSKTRHLDKGMGTRHLIVVLKN